MAQACQDCTAYTRKRVHVIDISALTLKPVSKRQVPPSSQHLLSITWTRSLAQAGHGTIQVVHARDCAPQFSKAVIPFSVQGVRPTSKVVVKTVSALIQNTLDYSEVLGRLMPSKWYTLEAARLKSPKPASSSPFKVCALHSRV